MTVLQLHGVYTLGPEGFICALMVWREGRKVVPIWISPVEGAELHRRLEDVEAGRRPFTHDLLLDSLNLAGGIEKLSVTSYYEGVFVGEVRTANGDTLDARVSDLLILAQISGRDVDFNEDIVHQTALKLSDSELEEFLGFTLGQDGDELSGPSEAEIDEILRSLEFDEGDAGSDEGEMS